MSTDFKPTFKFWCKNVLTDMKLSCSGLYEVLPETGWQPRVSSEHLRWWARLGWCKCTPGATASSRCPVLLFPHAPHNSPWDRCGTWPCTKIHQISEKWNETVPSQCSDKKLGCFYLKYWLAAASMALWQGNSCPWTHRVTSVSSLLTLRVSIPLCSSTGRPPSSQHRSPIPASLPASSFRQGSSPSEGKGQSVVLSSESLIFYTQNSSQLQFPLEKKKTGQTL